MDKTYELFAINPGPTSTKVVLFENATKQFSANVSHDAAKIQASPEISDQLPYRKETILGALASGALRVLMGQEQPKTYYRGASMGRI